MEDNLISVEMPYHNILVIASSTIFTLHCPQIIKCLHNYKLAPFSLFIYCVRTKNILSTVQMLKKGHCFKYFLI